MKVHLERDFEFGYKYVFCKLLIFSYTQVWHEQNSNQREILDFE